MPYVFGSADVLAYRRRTPNHCAIYHEEGRRHAIRSTIFYEVAPTRDYVASRPAPANQIWIRIAKVTAIWPLVRTAYLLFGFAAVFSAARTCIAQSLRPGTAFLVHCPEGNTFRHFAMVRIPGSFPKVTSRGFRQFLAGGDSSRSVGILSTGLNI